MTTTSVSAVLAGHHDPGTTVTVRGWLRTRRDSKAGLSFLVLSDGSCQGTLQVVAPNSLPNYTADVLRLSAGAAIIATGTVAPSAGKGQSVELQATTVEVAGFVEDPDHYPIQPKRHSLEFLREVAHLRPRTALFGAIARIRNAVSRAAHEFFQQDGFLWVHTPIITTSDCEGAGAMFRVSTLDAMNLPRNADGTVNHGEDFFGQATYLTVSGQLELETHCCALSKVYTFGPTFRAENSHTSRHLSEFWMIEPEVAFADLADDAELAERFLKHLFRAVLDRCGDDLAFLRDRVDAACIDRLKAFVGSTFERMDYTEAIRQLERKADKAKFEYPVRWGIDLQSEHERYLTEKIVKGPVVVMNYPSAIKAFYMRQNDDGRTVAAMDVLAPGIGEIIGGAQREERLDVLDERMTAAGLPLEEYGWYRDLRRYGTVPHAGFGLGLERTLAYVTGMANVRDLIPFPRTPGSAAF